MDSNWVIKLHCRKQTKGQRNLSHWTTFLSTFPGNRTPQFYLEGKHPATKDSSEYSSYPKNLLLGVRPLVFFYSFGARVWFRVLIRSSIFVSSNVCSFIPEGPWVFGHIFKRSHSPCCRHHQTNYSQWHLLGYQALGKFTNTQVLWFWY